MLNLNMEIYSVKSHDTESKCLLMFKPEMILIISHNLVLHSNFATASFNISILAQSTPSQNK